MPETQFASANGLTIAYETFGDPADPPALLVAGLAVQMLSWPDDLCELLASRGFYVIRADNRDIGLSTHIDAVPALRTRDMLRKRGPYSIADMATDTAELIKTLGLGPVHLVGASMGGFIAQTVALDFPAQVRSLTLIMTSTGSRRVGRTRLDVLYRMMQSRVVSGREGFIEAALETFRRIGSPGFELDEGMIRDIAGRSFDRDYDAVGRSHQLAAVVAQPNRTRRLRTLKLPTVVVHGLADPVVGTSGGLALARAIPGATFVGFSGMGHDVPRALWPRIVDEVVTVAAKSTTSGVFPAATAEKTPDVVTK